MFKASAGRFFEMRPDNLPGSNVVYNGQRDFARCEQGWKYRRSLRERIEGHAELLRGAPERSPLCSRRLAYISMPLPVTSDRLLQR